MRTQLLSFFSGFTIVSVPAFLYVMEVKLNKVKIDDPINYPLIRALSRWLLARLLLKDFT